MALAFQPIYTYKDYRQWEGEWELIAGQAVAMAPSPFGPHQGILTKMAADIENALGSCKEPCYLYVELDWVVDEYNVVRPDLMLTCKKVVDFVKKAPELVVEILSPSTALKDRTVKFELYQAQGVQWYVMVDLELQVVEVYKLDGHRYVLDQKSEDKVSVEVRGCRMVLDASRYWGLL